MTNSRAPYTLYSNDAYRRPTDDNAPEAVSNEAEKNLPESEVTESSATSTEQPESASSTSLHSVETTESEAETTATPVATATTETEAGTPSPLATETRPVETEAEKNVVASETESTISSETAEAKTAETDSIDSLKVDTSTESESSVTATEVPASPVIAEAEPQFPSGVDVVTAEAEKAEPILNAEAEAKANHLPGAYLKNVREQKHLSMEHVADKLCLHYALMRDLEADEYERLPAPVFVRGYLRAYANLLEEPAEQVLALYTQQELQSAPPPLTMHTTQTKRQTSSGDPWFKIISFGLFIGLMVLMTLWKLYPEQNSSAPSTAPLLPAPSANTEEARPALSGGQGQSLPLSSQPLSGMQPVPLSSNAGNSDIVYTPPEEDGAETSAANGNTTVITSDGSTSNAAANAEAATEATTETTAAAAEPDANANKVTLNLSANAWMQINDKDGKQVFLGTAQKGKSLDLEGTPPFKIRAGNFEGVSVTYKGEEKALADFPREGKRVYVVGGAQ